MTINAVSLCSGIGSFDYGLQRAGFNIIAQVEIDAICRDILRKNFGPDIPQFKDMTKLSYHKGHLTDEQKSAYIGRIDAIFGGIPCQPWSVAGNQKKDKDHRDLWPQTFKLVTQIRPTYVIIENVAGFKNLGFTRTKIDLEGQGYVVRPFIIPACAVGAQHRRDRIWIIAYNHSNALREQSGWCSGEDGEEKGLQGVPCEEKFATIPSGEGLEGAKRRTPEGQRLAIRRENGTTSHVNSDGSRQKPNATEKENHKGIWKDDWWAEAAAKFGDWWQFESGMVRSVHGSSEGLDGDKLKKFEKLWMENVELGFDRKFYTRPPKYKQSEKDWAERYRKARIRHLGNSVVHQIPEAIGFAIRELES